MAKQPIKFEDPLMDVSDVATYLRCSAKWARKLLARDNVPTAPWPGKDKRWRLSVIEAWSNGEKPWLEREGEKPSTQERAPRRGKKSLLPLVRDLVRL